MEVDTKCIICFENVKNPAHPDTCFHTFCTTCLLKWSKQSNQCPHDRKSFNFIVNSTTNEEIKVKLHRQRRNTRAQYDMSAYCDLCTEHPANETVIICDSCSLGYHLKCLNPPLNTVPPGSWQCPGCVKLERKIRKRGRKRLKRKIDVSNVNSICSGKISSSDPSHSSEEETTASDTSAVENSSGISPPTPFLGLTTRKRGRPRKPMRNRGRPQSSTNLPSQSSESAASSSSSFSFNYSSDAQNFQRSSVDSFVSTSNNDSVIDYANLPSTSENVQMLPKKDPMNDLKLVKTPETSYELIFSSPSRFSDVLILDDNDIFLSSDSDEERRVETNSVVTFATERDTSNHNEGNRSPDSDNDDDVISVFSKELAEHEETEAERTMNYDWKSWCKASKAIKKEKYLGNPTSIVSSENTYHLDENGMFKVPNDAFPISTGGKSPTENQRCVKNTSLISDTHNDVTSKASLRHSTSYPMPSLDNQKSVPSLSENVTSSNTFSLSSQRPIMELPHSIVSYSTNTNRKSNLVPQYSEVKNTQSKNHTIGNGSPDSDDDVISVFSKELAEHEEIEAERRMNYDWKSWSKAGKAIKKEEGLKNPTSIVSPGVTYHLDEKRMFKVPNDAFPISTGGISSTENQKCVEKNTSPISDTHNDVTFKASLRHSTSYSMPSLDNQISVLSLSENVTSAFPSAQLSGKFKFPSSFKRPSSTSIGIATSNSLPFNTDFYSDQNDREETCTENLDTCSIQISSVSSCRKGENSNISSLSSQKPIIELPHSTVSSSTNTNRESSLVPQYSVVKTTQPSLNCALINPEGGPIPPHSSSTPIIYPPLRINGLTYLSFDPARGMNDPSNIMALAELRKHFHPNFVANYYIHDKR